VLRSAKQGSEACARIESGQAQPIDRPVTADERRRFAIADERVVLDLSLGCGPAVNHGRYSEPDWRYTGHGEVPVQIPLALTHAPRHSPCEHVTL
jgi:hypothetical protein